MNFKHNSRNHVVSGQQSKQYVSSGFIYFHILTDTYSNNSPSFHGGPTHASLIVIKMGSLLTGPGSPLS